MNIALFTHELGLNGAPRALFNMAKCLISLGHNIDLYSPFNGPLGEELCKEGICIHVISGLLQDKPCESNKEYDIIIYNTIVSLVSAKNTANWKGRRIAWIHEGSFAYQLFSETTTSYGLGRELNFKELFKYVDEVYCVSDYSAEVTENYTDKNIDLLPYYIDHIEHTRNHKANNTLTVGMIGTVEERKGIKLLSDALNKVNFPIQVICVGDLRQPIQNPKIFYVGKQKHEDVIKMYDKFDFVICPSLDDPMPITCAEAFMMECPIFVSENSGTYSLIDNKKDGVTFDYNVMSLVGVLIWANKNKSILDGIGKKGKQIYLDNFTYDAFLNNIKEVIK